MHMEICSEDAKFRHGIDQDYSGLIQINPETAKNSRKPKKNNKTKKTKIPELLWTLD